MLPSVPGSEESAGGWPTALGQLGRSNRHVTEAVPERGPSRWLILAPVSGAIKACGSHGYADSGQPWPRSGVGAPKRRPMVRRRWASPFGDVLMIRSAASSSSAVTTTNATALPLPEHTTIFIVKGAREWKPESVFRLDSGTWSAMFDLRRATSPSQVGETSQRVPLPPAVPRRFGCLDADRALP